MRLSENAVEKQIVAFMQDNHWRAHRNHVGVFRGLTSDQRVTIGIKGWPDWTFIRRGPTYGSNQLVHVEVKRPGEKPRKDQHETMASLNHLGELSVWADSIESFKVLYSQYFHD